MIRSSRREHRTEATRTWDKKINRRKAQKLSLVVFEELESRIVRSVASAAPAIGDSIATDYHYRIDALTHGQASSTFGRIYTNSAFPDAQTFFDTFRDRFQQNPAPTPTPTPAPDPAPNLSPVTITQTPRGSLTQLTITGTTGNDSILVTQSGGILTITANDLTTTVPANVTEIAIYGGAGDDTITVDASVTIPARLYGGSGINTLVAAGTAKSYIVSLGGGIDTLAGNGINTSFWADALDTIHASATEIAAGAIHRVSAFYQPFTSTPGAAGYVPLTLNGPNLADPTDSGATIHLNNSLFGSGPLMADVNQGMVGDCYFLADIQSLALAQPGMLEQMAVDLGDGTYAVQFKRNGIASYARVDADLPTGSWNGLNYAHPLGGGPMWSAIFEKAYAYFRYSMNSYASLNMGYMGNSFSDLGIANNDFNPSSPAIFSALTTALANHKAITIATPDDIQPGVPLIGDHAYSVVSTSVVAGTQYVVLRNPWGFDGIGNDANPSDGLVKLTLSQLTANTTIGSVMA